MNKLQRLNINPGTQGTLPVKDRVALYDQYGSIAYGIILKILRQPDVAQRVLVDVFASPQLTGDFSGSPAGMIIKLAREKALAARTEPMQELSSFRNEKTYKSKNLPELVFDLSFCQGHKLEIVAEKLQITYTDVMKAIRDHFAYLRNR